MPYPSSDVDRTNLDASSDSPALARTSLLDLVDKFNQLRNFVSVFARGLLSAVDAAAARLALGLVIGTDVPSPTGTGATGTWPISIAGNSANGGVTSVDGGTGAITTKGLGKNQTVQDVKASRSFGLNYFNYTDAPILVSISQNSSTACYLYVDDVVEAYTGAASQVSAVVPVNSKYSCSSASSVLVWSETR